MKVLLKAANQYQLADCDFATGAEIDALSRWARHLRGPRNPRAADALEFAALARKRWRSYVRMNRTVQTVAELKKRIAADPTGEVAMFATIPVPAKSKSGLLGFCLFRRTWRNHLIVDLLAVNPSESGKTSRVGVSLLYFITRIGESIGAPFVWGEATEHSAGFYEKAFGVPVDDLFRIDAAVYRRSTARYLVRWRESGLPRR